MTTVSLSWDPTGGALYYQVFSKLTGTLAKTLLGVTSDTYFVAASLSAGKSYTFEVIPGDIQFYTNFGASLVVTTEVTMVMSITEKIGWRCMCKCNLWSWK
jgi:hypothetical protein